MRTTPMPDRGRAPIRVAFIDQVGRTAGGAERTLATFLKSAPPDIAARSMLFEEGSFADELRDLGIDVEIVAQPDHVASATREHGAVGAAFATPSFIWRVAQRLVAGKADVVYTNSMKAHVVGSLAARLARLPCVIHYHDLFQGQALRTLRAVSRLGSQHRIACSRLVATQMDVDNTSVIYGPVQLNDYRNLVDRRSGRATLGLTDDLPVVGLIGRINRWKGHDRFVRIAARVNADMPVRFAIVGAPIFRDADFVPELRTLVAESGMRDRVSFHPWVEDVRSVFAALDVNVNCSTREPFGRTIVEAAAAGVPTICFADSGASETIVDGVTGRTIEAGDEAGFARAIVQLLANRAKLPGFGEAARIAARRFDAPIIAEEMARVIRRAAAVA
jgi:glycosyltransferase involved in cell wall biosynthesis